LREVPLSRLCRESPLTPGRARHTLGSWWGWLFHPHRLPHGECGVWGRAPGRTRYAWQLRHLEAHQSRDRRDTSSRCDDSSKARVVTGDHQLLLPEGMGRTWVLGDLYDRSGVASVSCVEHDV